MDENRHKVFYTCDALGILIPLLVKYTNLDLEITRKLEKLEKVEQLKADEVTTDASEGKGEREKRVEKLKAAYRETEQVLVKVCTAKKKVQYKNPALALHLSLSFFVNLSPLSHLAH
jgi:hypothetical protein